ncbi:carboxypeptidase [Aurantiacibacter xanthus]|uniref:Carboxypeptidase n=1 Tax=Aurantiacibacter xanthus TaxID=1784712 RepID=A0A3A1P8B9_9SPHN|nr:M14 family zinc carboxypeptidase [Aurantiacibacter xanthus]RIV87390.1 carboxypeptidase [Aurantiacibacter xanthus]
MIRHAIVRAALLGAASLLASTPLAAQSILPGTFDPAIPELRTVVGHAPGDEITAPADVLTYMQALAAAAPDRVHLIEYAQSWEGRPLVYAVIASPANMARIDAIKADMGELSRGLAPAAASAIIERTVPVTWLSYGVHGDEISSTDAALALAYHLLASERDAAVDTILANSVVIIDPSQNPDGRNRFVQSTMAARGLVPQADPDTAEHDQPWPGGRVNHYLFDLNRDWFALTQPETRGKVAALRDWQPVVFVDAHEMGGESTYFMPPVANPINPNITTNQIAAQELLGRNNAAALDAIGQPYYTREVFDAFYPGYGDSWPMLNGSIGMTFEQASSRGLVYERPDGSLLTYRDTVRNHFTTTLATAYTVATNARRFLTDYADYRRSAATGEAGRGSYLIDLASRRWNAEQLGRRLALQGIAVRQVGGPASACGKSHPQGYLAVPREQGTGRLVRALLDEQTDLPAFFVAEQEDRRSRDLPHELYDSTAWSLGLMSGVDVSLCGNAAGGVALAADTPLPDRTEAPGAFGLAVPWSDSGQVRLVAEALRAGLTGRSSSEAFTAGGRTYPRGSVVFTAAANAGKLGELNALARTIGAETRALANGWVEDGPNLGSDSTAVLTAPRIAMLWDDGVSPLSAGALRYVIEQRLAMPVAAIRTGKVSEADLSHYDVVLVPDGNPARALGASGVSALSRFAEEGGLLVAIGRSIMALNRGDEPLLATRPESAAAMRNAKEKPSPEGATAPGTEIATLADYRNLIGNPDAMPDIIPGALLNTAVDPDTILSAGYEAGPVVNASGNLIFTPLARGTGTNAVRYAAPEELLASGYIWDENRRQMAFKPYLMAQEHGDGLVVGFAQDPSTRGYLDGLDLLIANAVLQAPARYR